MRIKECRYCSEAKLISEFTRNSKAPDGHCNVCKSCAMDYRRYLRTKRTIEFLKEKTKDLPKVDGEYSICFD